MRIVVCGGGTAGHITPVLAVIDALHKIDKSISILFIGTGSELERSLVKKARVEYCTIPAGKFRRYRRGLVTEATDFKLISQNIGDVSRSIKGYTKAKRILKRFKPDVVFTKGGYVTVPVGFASSRLGIPLVIHESDAVFGLASRLLAKKATTIATGFPSDVFSSQVAAQKLVHTGNPVRQELTMGSKQKAQKTFGFKNLLPVVFVVGGSQGAAALNTAVFEGLEVLLRKYNVIHHTGTQGIEEARVLAYKLPQALRAHYQPYDFLHGELTDALFVANLAVVRPSASTIAEIAAHSIPTIVVPSPYSSNGHQQANAAVLRKSGAVRVLEQTNLTSISLCAQIDKVLESKKSQMYLGRNIHAFWQPNAAGDIAQAILNVASK